MKKMLAALLVLSATAALGQTINPRQIGPATVTIDPRNPPYGAKCDWNGSSGTDDTSAFQSAATAAAALYAAHGASVNIMVPNGCVIGGTVTAGSGVHFIGPGSIFIPNQTAGGNHTTLHFTNADNVSVERVTIGALTPCPTNDANCAAIRWDATSSDSMNHAKVAFRGNTINNTDWGILVTYAQGTGSLSDVTITDNTVQSPAGAYSNHDGIHIDGRVSGFTVNGNRVFYRNDAGLACSATSTYLNGPGVFSANVATNNLVGLDDSGCSKITWESNDARAASTSAIAGPAFRAIYYQGAIPTDVTVSGNTLQIGSHGGAYTVQIDPYDFVNGSSITMPLNLSLINNVIQTPSASNRCVYLRGSSITLSGNTLYPNCIVTVGVVNPTVETGILIGRNNWMGAGLLDFGTAGLSTGVLDAQNTVGTLTVQNLGTGNYAQTTVTFAALAGAGTGASVPVCVSGFSCTPSGGAISFTTGTGAASGVDIVRASWIGAVPSKKGCSVQTYDQTSAAVVSGIVQNTGSSTTTMLTLFMSGTVPVSHALTVTYSCN